jgi:hypothetical protein
LSDQPRTAYKIALGPIFHVVSQTVDLNRKTGFGAIKIKYIGSDWMLAAEDWLSSYAQAQVLPQSRFRGRHSATKATSLNDCLSWRTHRITESFLR